MQQLAEESDDENPKPSRSASSMLPLAPSRLPAFPWPPRPLGAPSPALSLLVSLRLSLSICISLSLSRANSLFLSGSRCFFDVSTKATDEVV